MEHVVVTSLRFVNIMLCKTGQLFTSFSQINNLRPGKEALSFPVLPFSKIDEAKSHFSLLIVFHVHKEKSIT